MGKKAKRPELCVHRAFTNERPMLDLFADAYRVYFDEMRRAKSSECTFDTCEVAEYNEATSKTKEGKSDGTAA